MSDIAVTNIQPSFFKANPMAVLERVRVEKTRLEDASLVNIAGQINQKELPNAQEVLGRFIDIYA